MSRRLAVLLSISGALQVALSLTPDGMGDVLQYRIWARTLASSGLAEAYWPARPPEVSPDRLDRPIDYPPVVPYLLWLIGHGSVGLPDRAVDVLVRLPFVAANLLLGILLYRDARRRVRPESAARVAGLYLLNPAVLFESAYWGQSDALCALLVAASLLALGRDRVEPSWALLALAVLVKPLAWPFVPLLALVTLRRFGARRALAGVAAFLGCALAALVPFAWTHTLPEVLRSLSTQIDAMPYMSVNAHNAWWLVERGTPWLASRARVLGPLSWEGLALIAFGSYYAVTLARLWRSCGERAVRLAAASVAFGFFMLATHMHEHHLFGALPLVLLVDPSSKRLRVFFVLISTTLLANMLLHDPLLTHAFRPLTPGRHLVLPQQPEIGPAFFEYFLRHGYAPLVEQIRGETSLLGVVFTMLNSQANVLIFSAWLLCFYRRRDFETALAEPLRIRWRVVFPLVLIFLAGSTTSFLARAFREDRRLPQPRVAVDSSIVRR